jgi:steroid 5-alpha reductase family enzyme
MFIALALFGSICISAHLMFFEAPEMFPVLIPYKINGNFVRNILLLSCFCIYFLRLMIGLLVFFKRKMYWAEAIVIASIMPSILPYIAYISGKTIQPIGIIEIFGILLFLIGSYLNTVSELLRYYWKKKEKNRGHIYTGGLFKYAIHINYFGDILLFTGLVAIAHQVELLIIPASMGLFFALILIPLKEKHLKRKYGKDFKEYASNTKKLIPIIY